MCDVIQQPVAAKFVVRVPPESRPEVVSNAVAGRPAVCSVSTQTESADNDESTWSLSGYQDPDFHFRDVEKDGELFPLDLGVPERDELTCRRHFEVLNAKCVYSLDVIHVCPHRQHCNQC